MEVFKYEIDVIENYSYADLMETIKNLNVALFLTREIKDDYMTMGNTIEAINQEKIILVLCENLETIEAVMLSQEISVFNNHDLTSVCLN